MPMGTAVWIPLWCGPESLIVALWSVWSRYTDVRGKFDYVSLSTSGEVQQVDRFAILVASKTHGAVTRECSPPAM